MSLLLGIDFEDPRDIGVGGRKFPNRLGERTSRLLEIFQKHQAKATFFVVGSIVPENVPVLREVVGAGHEIAAHSFAHRELTHYSKEEFTEDLRRNLHELENTLGVKVQGYRAPSCSLVPETEWVWDVLEEHGIRYSSSVMPTYVPYLYWKKFGRHPRQVRDGLWEIPLSFAKFFGIPFPFLCGIYCRLTPRLLLPFFVSSLLTKGEPVVSYLHPYDFDAAQPRHVMNTNRIMNLLMYYGRGKMEKTLDALVSKYPTTTYQEFVKNLTDKPGL